MSSLKQRLKECVPPAYYSDGREAKCMWFKVFNMFDIDPQSYIIDKKNNGMKEFNITESTEGSGFITSENLVADLGKEFILNGQRVTVEDGIVVVKK